jgi:hypothetical protein
MSDTRECEYHYCMKCLDVTPWAIIGRFRVCVQCKSELLFDDAALKTIEAISEKKGGPDKRV